MFIPGKNGTKQPKILLRRMLLTYYLLNGSFPRQLMHITGTTVIIGVEKGILVENHKLSRRDYVRYSKAVAVTSCI